MTHSLYPTYPRDLAGYGRNPPQPRWPGQARVALQFVLNYEEGGENSVLHGDAGSEQFLSEMSNPAAYPAPSRSGATPATAWSASRPCAPSAAPTWATCSRTARRPRACATA